MDYEYRIRTDLAIQNKTLNKSRGYKINNLIVKKFCDNKNNFVNILFNNVELKENREDLKIIIVRELKKFLKKYQIKKSTRVLVVGLGNQNIISDSVGIKAVSYVKSTAYLNQLMGSKSTPVYTFIPGVFKNTGFMAYNAIKALVKELKIDLVIIIDSLICDSIVYLNKLIQITDKGITPGSGIINYQEEISLKTLKVPVLVLGVPTAIEASSIIKDVQKIQEDKIKYKEGYDLIVSKKDVDIFINQIGEVLGASINDVFK